MYTLYCIILLFSKSRTESDRFSCLPINLYYYRHKRIFVITETTYVSSSCFVVWNYI